MMRPAYFPDRFVAEPQRNIETPQDQNQRTVIPDQIAHFIAGLITVRIIHPFLKISVYGCKITHLYNSRQYQKIVKGNAIAFQNTKIGVLPAVESTSNFAAGK
ncbi:MAG: hypothetical protein ACLSVO_08360 [Alistipes sp.]|jgi:hypothetical protein|uniref:hypothetical protein n=1 Tax=Alistipes TaxID=239759 RepID=UPI003996214A|nr:hypothetical protein [Rikenellaceae bacterium]